MTRKLTESFEALQISLHSIPVAILTHQQSNRNQLIFDPAYKAIASELRPRFTLRELADPSYLDTHQISSQRLSPVLSNLLPEGIMREWLSKALKVHIDNEFALLAYTGSDLPGALTATPTNAIPFWAIDKAAKSSPMIINTTNQSFKFSLAGVQVKFSSAQKEGRFNISHDQAGESWIIKTPSNIHRHVPENEFTSMRLAEAIGVNIPEISLVALDKLDNLPDIELPNETYAYAIKRFDRYHGGRIHSEDFAQVMGLYAHDKYNKANYEQIAKLLYDYTFDGLSDVQQMSRRLLANILLANGDAHLKNWTVYYPNQMTPQLAPAYDIVSTRPYMKNERNIALNMGKTKDWYKMTLETFEVWANRIDVPWPAIRAHLKESIELARDTWPNLIKDLPMHGTHKISLKEHWAQLHQDFRV